jgi:hypothetical protein
MISFIIEILESESYYYFIVLPGFYKMIPNVKEKIASGTPIGLAVTPEVNTHCRMKVMSWKTLIIS